MLDTLRLTLDDFQVRDDADLEISFPTVNASTGVVAASYPLWRGRGGTVKGTKAFHNGERINITLQPMRENPGAQALCVVQFSVPKVATGGNYHAADANGTNEALNTVAKYLDTVGISTNLERAAISRLDAAKTEVMREPFAGYAPVLSRLQGKRVQRREYGTTFLWGNTQWETCAYDKIEEMRHAKLRTDGLALNSLRMELRALKSQKVKSLFGLRTVEELRDGLGHVRDVYRSQLEKQLFKAEVPEESLLSSSDFIEQLKAAQAASPRWYEAWRNAQAMHHLAPQMDALKHAVRVVSPNRTTANRVIKQLEQAEREGMALKQVGPSRRTWGELYNELRDKVLS